MIDIEIETWCSKKQRQELIMLMCEEKDAVGAIVKGKPVHCSDEAHCSKSPPVATDVFESVCLLNAISLETRRKNVVA